MPRSLRWSFSLRLGQGSGFLMFDHEGGAYQSVWCPSWCLSSGPPTESGLAVVGAIGSGKGSSECGAQPGGLECERGLRCRLEGGATKSPRAGLRVSGLGAVGDSDRDGDELGGAQPGVAVPLARGNASCLSAQGGGAACILMG
jgi:hypothetical protein